MFQESLRPGGTWSLSPQPSKAQEKRAFAVLNMGLDENKVKFPGNEISTSKECRGTGREGRESKNKGQVIEHKRLCFYLGMSSLLSWRGPFGLWQWFLTLRWSVRRSRPPTSPVSLRGVQETCSKRCHLQKVVCHFYSPPLPHATGNLPRPLLLKIQLTC